MDFDEDKIEESEGDYVEIYSRRAIFWFAVFSPLYAGILLIINLWVAGYKWVISQVILFLLFSNLLLLFIVRALNIKPDLEALRKFVSGSTPLTSFSQVMPFFQLFCLTLVFNIVAGIVLTRYFFKKYFPDDDYYPRSVLWPILIYVLLTLFLGGGGF
ncbi:hypothetical protein G7092_07650 [Mucilaginibacter sp. HC2]|uniref:hypothetical protein n=1 Tax=Mucilaginibacter inviolabilis TaxID=2714892 RepID=UPI00140D57B0|nr:hypothetical protein [Mucilaginibacter inviolabilis]NHA03663.1 hypothetical protein [Mucilaginibacter inviolabilis]